MLVASARYLVKNVISNKIIKIKMQLRIKDNKIAICLEIKLMN